MNLLLCFSLRLDYLKGASVTSRKTVWWMIFLIEWNWMNLTRPFSNRTSMVVAWVVTRQFDIERIVLMRKRNRYTDETWEWFIIFWIVWHHYDNDSFLNSLVEPRQTRSFYRWWKDRFYMTTKNELTFNIY